MELEVSLADTPVGVLRRSSDRGDATRFRFHDSYRQLAVRPVLGQVYEDYLDAEWGATQRLPPFFSNLLPEGPMREHLAVQLGVHPDRELYLLVHLGRDLPGAVLVRPLTRFDADDPPPARSTGPTRTTLSAYAGDPIGRDQHQVTRRDAHLVHAQRGRLAPPPVSTVSQISNTVEIVLKRTP